MDGYWRSYDELGRRKVLGPSGWSAARWPSVPLTRMEHWLVLLALALLGIWLAIWWISPMLRSECHSMAVCAAEPTALNAVALAAFVLNVGVTIVLLVHHTAVKKRSASAEASTAG